MDNENKMSLTAILEIIAQLKQLFPEALQTILDEMDLSDEALAHFENNLQTLL